MKQYLLDTNICIFFIKGKFSLLNKINEVGNENCLISEITVAELKYGIENSNTIETLRPIVESFLTKFKVVPIYDSLDVYAKQKAKLRKKGMLIDDFDLLIASTSIQKNLIMVTNNVEHFKRLENIEIQDWTK